MFTDQLYLYKLCQNSLLCLIFAVAQETVCIDVVFIAIEGHPDEILSYCIIGGCEGNLSGCSTQIQ